jgi:hypothetical protein
MHTELEKTQIEVLREQESHAWTLRRYEYAEQCLGDIVDALQDLTGDFYGEHSNENCPWENAVNALQEMADAKHASEKTPTINTSTQ